MKNYSWLFPFVAFAGIGIYALTIGFVFTAMVLFLGAFFVAERSL